MVRLLRATVTAILLLALTLPVLAATNDPPKPSTGTGQTAQPQPQPGTQQSAQPGTQQSIPSLPDDPARPRAQQAGGYTDLPETHWAYPLVMKLRDAGVISGDPSGRFRPNDPIKRSELLKMLLYVRKIDAGKSCRGQFRDVPCWAWYAPVMETSYRMAIPNLQGEDQLAPDGTVNRQELFTLTVRALGRRWVADSRSWRQQNALLSPYADDGDISEWAQSSMAQALADGVLTGYGDGTLRPLSITTRAEAAAVISRVLLGSDGLQTVQVDGRTIVFKQAFTMRATEYSSGEPGVGWMTSTGIVVRPGTVAVDPSVIPLGRLVYVEGYGYAVAADTGGAIKGNRIDLFVRDPGDAGRFGAQSRRVWLLP